ncbi:MAG: magnesium-translocating P-type ATPase [Patescibacteria group bacterium]|jgi:Mg2+-importing ATPase
MLVGNRAAPWSVETEEVLSLLDSNEKGLSIQEAKTRLVAQGPNEIKGENSTPAWLILARQFKSPLTLILVFASAIAYFLGDTTQVAMILAMVFLSSLLAFVQEYRSEKALRMLRKKLTRYATVIRSNKSQTVDARELVIGDIVVLQVGSVIPADLRLIQTEDLEIDEAILTGESVPVPKIIDAVGKKKLTPQEQTNMAFMGTHVVQGSARGVVTSVGKNTEMGKTALLLVEKTQETDYQKGMRTFGGFILKVTFGLIILVGVGLGLLRGNWIESVLFALALAVGLSPELFPMIVTINLSRGAIMMSKKSVLVKRLISIEDLGNADVFCTDKTGTLTVGKIRVRESIDPNGEQSNLPLAYAAHCLALNAEGRAENPIDQALFEATRGKRIKAILTGTKLFDIVSFDFNRRRMSCVVGKNGGVRSLIAKGAVKETLSVCTTSICRNGESKEMTTVDRKRLMKLSDQYQDDGYRVIAVARRSIQAKQKYLPSDEKQLEFLGFILMSDAPKQTAKAALLALKNLNVRINILTGDSERITRHVAEQLNFEIIGALNGDKIARLDDAQLEKAVEKANIFTGITPSQKLRIIQALKKNGHTVGYMGDGVNDAPSLRAADVGISFDSAIDIAKEAAGVILLKKNLMVLVDGIREGRRTFANTQTYINTTISSNFGNMLSLAGMSLLLPFIPMLPAQILLLNFLTDMPMIGISSDRVSEDDLTRPRQWNTSRIANYMYFFGIISSVADYATFGILYFIVHADMALFRSGWFVESVITEVIVIFLLRTRRTKLSNLPSGILTALCVIAIGISILITNTVLGGQFELVSLNLKLLTYIVVIVLGYALLVEMGKRAFYKYVEKQA